MTDMSDGKVGSKGKPSNLRLTLIGADEAGGQAVSGLYVGQVCHNHVLADIYIDIDATGHVTAVHPDSVGSC